MEGEGQRLELPDHGVKTKQSEAGRQVFDPVRKRWVALTPEEWVRQHFINHLVHDKGCPASLIAVEHALELNGMVQRADIVVHDRQGRPVALVECKAPTVRIVQATFDQAARYNLVFRVPFLIVTNGLQHYACLIHHEQCRVEFLGEVPDHAAMCAWKGA